MTTPSFQNIYYKRAVGTAKPCYMCYRPTTTVLATINTIDFFYTCDGHLKDSGFANRIEPQMESATTKKLSDEEIQKIKEEWEERQKRKEEKHKADKAAADKEKVADIEKSNKERSSTSKSPPPPPAPIPVPGSTAATKFAHEKYVLHRDVWAMRLGEHRKKRQIAAAKEVAPRLPSTPRGL